MADFIMEEMDREGGTMEVMGRAMARYLRENTTVIFSWSGLSPEGLPDPWVSFQSADVQGDFSFAPTGTNDPQAAMRDFAEQVRRGCAGFTVGPPDGFSLPRISLNAHAPPQLEPAGAGGRAESFRFLCARILAAYKTYINPAPLAGSRGQFASPPGAGAAMQGIF